MTIVAALRRIWSRLRSTTSASERADADLREELQAHLEMQIAENVRRGMSPEEARRDALLAAGGLTLATEAVREQRRLPVVDAIAADLRYTLRNLRARPGFALAVTLTLAIAIGANTAIFSVVDAVVLHPLPYANADRILSVSESNDGVDAQVVDDHSYFAWQHTARTVTLAAVEPTRDVLTLRSGPEQLAGAIVDEPYFSILGITPRLGRAMTHDDFADGAPDVVLLSEQLWRRAFDADEAVVGRPLRIGDKRATIIGVMPSRATTSGDAQYWLPFREHESPSAAGLYRKPTPGGFVTYYWPAIARLNPGATIEQARAELAARMPPADVLAPDHKVSIAPVVMTLAESRFGDQRKPALLLFAAVSVLLLIACANLANLALVRAAARQREFAVRLALGASRSRLARLLLGEGLLLGTVGGLLGLLFAWALLVYFVHLSPKSVGNPDGVRLNALVLVFTMVVAIASSLAFSLAPVVAAGRGDIARALSSGTPRASAGTKQKAFRRILVVAQLATALVLLTGAALVARSFYHVASIDLGFKPDGLIAVPINLPSSRYPDARADAFDDELAARARQLPHVGSVSFGLPPLAGIMNTYGRRDSTGTMQEFIQINASRGYFETIGARLISGRGFAPSDGPTSPHVVVINAAMAHRLYPGRDAVGKTMPGPQGPATIIGVIENVRPQIEAQPTAVVYPSIEQLGGAGNYNTLLVRATARGAAAAATEEAIKHLVRSMDPLLPPPQTYRLEQRVAKAVAPRAFVFVLLTMFAAIAATLAVIGLYGLIARTVVERTREIGIRIALGAPRRGVIATVLAEGLSLVLVGGVLGFGGSFAAARVMRALVYETNVYDPLTFTGAAVLLVAVATLAAYLPARRATTIDPVRALRED